MTLIGPPDKVHHKPMYSIVLAVDGFDSDRILATLNSLYSQTNRNFELILVGREEFENDICHILEVTYDKGWTKFHTKNSNNIADMLNFALSIAEGDYVGFLNCGDTLSHKALDVVSQSNIKNFDLIYTDEDQTTAGCDYPIPFYKPDFSPVFLMNSNYVRQFTLFRRTIIDRIGGFRGELSPSCLYDLILRVVEKTDRVLHVDEVLFHSSSQSMSHEQDQMAIESALARRKLTGQVHKLSPGYYHITYTHTVEPLISIIVLTRDKLHVLRACIESIVQKTKYNNYEIIVVNNGSVETETISYLSDLEADARIRVLHADIPFNYSKLNNMASELAKGEFLVFLNNDTEVIEETWLDELLGYGSLPSVGGVGALLLFTNKTIQHCGVTLPGPIHMFAGDSLDSLNHSTNRINVARECMAVTGACFFVRKSLFNSLNGFDEELDVEYNDIDLCFRIQTHGLDIVINPKVKLYHHESVSRGKASHPRNVEYFRTKWSEVLRTGDKYFSYNKIRKESMLQQLMNKEVNNIVIFGASASGEQCLIELNKIGKKVHCFLDNAKEKRGTSFCGVPVYSPEQINEIELFPKTVILASSGPKKAMRDQLEGNYKNFTIIEF